MDRFHPYFDNFHEVSDVPPHFWQNKSRLGDLIGTKSSIKNFQFWKLL